MTKRQREQDHYMSKMQKVSENQKIIKAAEMEDQMDDESPSPTENLPDSQKRVIRKVRRDEDPWFNDLVKQIEARYPINEVDADGDTEMGRTIYKRRTTTKPKRKQTSKKLTKQELYNIRLKNLQKARAAKAAKAKKAKRL